MLLLMIGIVRASDGGKVEWNMDIYKLYLQQWRQKMDEKGEALRNSGEQQLPYEPGDAFVEDVPQEPQERSAAQAAQQTKVARQQRSPKSGKKSINK